MKSLRPLVVGCATLASLAGCRSGVLPASNLPGPVAVQSENVQCGARLDLALTICIAVPKSGVDSLVVTDSIIGDGEAVVGKPIRIDPSRCGVTGNDRVCAASFTNVPARTLNQIGIEVRGSTSALSTNGAFPIEVATKSIRRDAVVDGTGAISALALVPFHGTSTQAGAASSLPLGQDEHVWVVPEDAQHRVIIGTYRKPISVTATSNDLQLSQRLLTTSGDAQALTAHWRDGYAPTSPSPVKLKARSGTVAARPAPIRPVSGVVYYQSGPNRSGLGAGPVAVEPKSGDVYFAINDASDAGCRSPGNCTTRLARFERSTRKFTYVPVPAVPGASQLFFTSDGALWMATFAATGSWNHPLPAYRMPPKEFSKAKLAPLPTATFGEPSGFVEDGSGNLWISSCKGSDCKQNQNGTPVLLETAIGGSYKNPATVKLPMNCSEFGYSGYSVGDVGYYPPNGSLYVLGLNDGSPPPARGTLWQYSPASKSGSCVSVPSNFNPSPFFALLQGASKEEVLAFGTGGNDLNFRWEPDHGFYLLTGSVSQPVQYESGPTVTANHVSSFAVRSLPGATLYYVASGKLDLKFSGLGTYVPSANGAWSIFPSASFKGDQYHNGVAAVSNGAWFTAGGVCGDGWQGICLAHAIIVPSASAWGALPGLYLPRVVAGTSAGFGVITDPEGSSNDASPFNVHSGPLSAHSSNNNVCALTKITELTFSVTGVHAGVCQITITQRGKNAGPPQAVVTAVK